MKDKTNEPFPADIDVEALYQAALAKHGTPFPRPATGPIPEVDIDAIAFDTIEQVFGKGRNMRKPSAGMHRLAHVVGGACAAALLVWLFLRTAPKTGWPTDGADWAGLVLIAVIAPSMLWLAVWGAIMGTYRLYLWVRAGFEVNNQTGESE